MKVRCLVCEKEGRLVIREINGHTYAYVRHETDHIIPTWLYRAYGEQLLEGLKTPALQGENEELEEIEEPTEEEPVITAIESWSWRAPSITKKPPIIIR